MALTIEMIQKGKVTIAKIVGDSLETDNVAAFRTAIAPVLEKSSDIALDLSQVGFMDSTGLGAMLSCLRAVKGKGGQLRLFNLTPEVRQLFEMVLMDRVFEIHEDEQSALA